jgi:hypothetical protein
MSQVSMNRHQSYQYVEFLPVWCSSPMMKSSTNTTIPNM